MVFSSPLFLFQFLPVFLAIYYLCPNRYRNFIALGASVWFYSWGAPRFIFLLAVSSFADFIIAPKLQPTEDIPGDRSRKKWLTAGLIVNLGVLFYFKYTNFFIAELSPLLTTLGMTEFYWTDIGLPIGISFFTFQKISYLMDVYRGINRPATSFINYFLYVSLFPQLIAGPIIRYHDVAKQLTDRQHTSSRMFSGIWRFCLGLAKKVLIANALGEIAGHAFALDKGVPDTGFAWLGILCYTFQIYFDFSGYSDMAIGLGRMLGFEYLENFNAPYIARNFTEFWKRWHISLSNWMREYLYFPLGGNRHGPVRTIFNLWLVFLISGIWHGASWNFLIWGAFHGFFLSLDKIGNHFRIRPLPTLIAVPTTFILIMLGWVFFRADTLGHAVTFLGALVGQPGTATSLPIPAFIDSYYLTILALALFFSFIPLVLSPELCHRLEKMDGKAWWQTGVQFSCTIILLVLSACTLASGSFNPFIYFRF
ncbi:MAG: MBOAT family protein [Thermodesulfobacteriota bacterium]|nr:MBOAT family protein [Thermodesulfobacteriota bacterium]